eukprot:183611_1
MSNRNPRKVYVSNISRDCRERDLSRLFEEVGRIDTLQFKSRFAFIEFERSRACDDAIHKFDGIHFMGLRLRVEQYCYRGGDHRYRSSNKSDGYRLYITNLDRRTSWRELKDFGRTIGKSINYADVRVINKGEVEGIIEYSDIGDFEHAFKELDGARLNGVRIKVSKKSSYDETNNNYDNRDRSRDKLAKDRMRNKVSRSRSTSRNRKGNKGRSYSRSTSRNRKKGNKGRSYSRSRSRSKRISRSRSRNKNRSDKNDRNHSKRISRSRSET